MKNKLRFLALLIALIMCVNMLPIAAFAEDPVTDVVSGVQAYSVTGSANPTGGGTISGGGSVNYGDNATLTAAANDGYTFVNWTENETVVGTEASITLSNVTDNHTLVANFNSTTTTTTITTPETYSVTGSANPTSGGTISGGGSVNYGDNATLTAAANDGYTFVNWTEGGNVVGSEACITITNVTSIHTLVANFNSTTTTTTITTPETYSVTATANPEGGGSITGGGNISSGGNAMLTATASTGYSFVNWTEGETVIGTEASITLSNVTAERALVANFELQVPANEQLVTRNVDQTRDAGEATVQGGESGNEEVTSEESGSGNGSGTGTGNENGTADAAEDAGNTEKTYKVTVSSDGRGSVTATPTSGAAGTEVKLIAKANSGYEFTQWQVLSGDVTINDDKFKIGTSDVSVKALFERVSYTVTAGANGGWIKGTLLPYSITAKRGPTDNCNGHFMGVVIDSTILPITDYIVSYGSVTVTIMPYALQKLSNGIHTVTFWFDDGTVSTFLYIWADPRYPATGDERQTTMWAALSGATLVGMGAILILGRMYGKKKKKNKD